MGPKSILSSVTAYVTLQRLVGADVLRRHALSRAAIRPGEVLVDIGCGPAYYFDWLPAPLGYHGYDTNQRYIDHATRKYGDRGNFRCAIFDAAEAARIPAPDVIVMLGLLHHLSDTECSALLTLCAQVLAPNGRVVSIDTAYLPGQNRFSKWLSDNDRGDYVRHPDQFTQLAAVAFDKVEGTPLQQSGRMLGSYWMMHLSAPATARPEFSQSPSAACALPAPPRNRTGGPGAPAPARPAFRAR